MRVSITLLAVFLLVFVCAASAAAFDLDYTRHTVAAGLQQQDDTPALFVKVDPARKPGDWEPTVGLDLEASALRSPLERGNGSVAFGRTWSVGHEIASLTDVVAGQDFLREFTGNLRIGAGFESGPDNERQHVGSWQFYDLNAFVAVEQDIPWARVRLPWTGPDTWPFRIGASYAYVQDVTGRSNTSRGSFSAELELPVYKTLLFAAFLRGRGEWYLVSDGSYHRYAEGNLSMSLPVLKLVREVLFLPNFGDPFLFVNYRDGAKPPQFIDKGEWSGGFGSRWEW